MFSIYQNYTLALMLFNYVPEPCKESFRKMECDVATSWQLRSLMITGSMWCLLEGCHVHPLTSTHPVTAM